MFCYKVIQGWKGGAVGDIRARGANSVIQRKLVQVITPSTTVEGNIGPDANYLLAIKEGSTILDDGSVVYGFAFVDCARLRFWVGSIDGDASCSALGALLMQACFGTS